VLDGNQDEMNPFVTMRGVVVVIRHFVKIL